MDFQQFPMYMLVLICFISNVLAKYRVLPACGSSQSFDALLIWSDLENFETVTVNGCIQNEIITKVFVRSNLNVVEAETFVNLAELNSISMDNVNLQLLKQDFFKNTLKLKYISAANNRLTTITRGIFKNLNMETLTLRSNLINVIDNNAFENLNVGELNLANNHLTKVDEHWFLNVSIEYLHLNHNKIVSLNKNAFNQIKNLSHVNLDYNGMFYIEDGTFVRQRNLLKLGLAGNALTDTNFLSGVTVRSLDIGFNKLNDVIMGNSTEIQTIQIYPNPWNCDCLQKFWKRASEKQMKYDFSSKLSEPWDERKPICIARGKCGEVLHYQSELYKSYFKTVNYIELSAYIYDSEYIL